METREIIKAIKKLPINKRLLVIESALKSIRENESRKKMVKAADLLLSDYINDVELTSFSQLDFEDFYEAR
ncbi:MAG: hypothetical protein AB9834_20680 [Lentimicrobium sp.]